MNDESKRKRNLNISSSPEVYFYGKYVKLNQIYYSSSDSILLTGHIKLLKSLLSCQGVDKREVGRAVIPQFLTTYLFPASKLISEGGLSDTASGQTTSRFFFVIVIIYYNHFCSPETCRRCWTRKRRGRRAIAS